jgi:hypothetical protein
MGELITDEEIDTMIGIVDFDGDGQVSFHEFRSLVLHPDPSHPSFALDAARIRSEREEREEALKKVSGTSSDAVLPLAADADIAAYQRQKDIIIR